MYIYIIKCCNFYKIGYSKNPKNRRATIQTHNPLDVILCATLKTEHYKEKEKELHNLFATKRTRGEWFELKNDDLIKLQIEYGFSFKIPVSKINDDDNYEKTNYQTQTNKFRIDNYSLEYCIKTFESLFDCKIQNNKEIRRCCIKFEEEIVLNAINSLFTQDYDSQRAYNMLYKVCDNMMQIKTNPSKYIAKIVKAIYYKHYNYTLQEEEVTYIENNFDTRLDADDVIKTLNSKKFYMDNGGFWDFIQYNYLNELS